jgi:hypothetical protein
MTSAGYIFLGLVVWIVGGTALGIVFGRALKGNAE